MNEILWELFYFLFGFPLMVIGVLLALMVIIGIFTIVAVLCNNPSEKFSVSSQSGGGFYDNCLPSGLLT